MKWDMGEPALDQQQYGEGIASPQPTVDDKTRRYRQAAEYNSLLLNQKQERGPFYVR